MVLMESFVFKTACGTMGVFQRSGETCYVCLVKEFWPDIRRFNWSEYEVFIQNGRGSLPQKSLACEESRYICYFVWHCHGNVNPDIVELSKSWLPTGVYCKRINRGSVKLFELTIRDHSTIDEVRSYNNLVDSLNEIFKVIEPDKANKDTYGHRIREILTIACAEVEYLFLQILKDNGYIVERYTTKDFIKLSPVLKLEEYSVELKMHPGMGVFEPFKGWHSENPTKSLPWYDSYNAAKHDRGGNFSRASLGAAINAIAAVHILLEAQYGKDLFNKPLYSEYESCFHTKKHPEWEVGQVFAPKFEGEEDAKWLSSCQYFDLPSL